MRMMYDITRVDIIPQLNDKQLDRLSEFVSNLSLLVVATLVLPNIFEANFPDTKYLLSGIALTILLLSISMILVRKK